MKKLLISLVAIVPALCAHGFDVYFYDTTTGAEVLAATDAHTVSFAADLTTIDLNDGTTQSVETGKYDMLSFKKKSLDGIDSTAAAASAGISIVKDGRLVMVSAAGPIERVEIVTASGAVVAQLSSPTGSLTIDTAGLADGVYVVRAVSDKQTTVSKFIL